MAGDVRRTSLGGWEARYITSILRRLTAQSLEIRTSLYPWQNGWTMGQRVTPKQISYIGHVLQTSKLRRKNRPTR
jgi:hypothetical protein